jgi:NADPH-dependent ferric siderophore reductase
METTLFKKLRTKANRIIDQQLLKCGTVLEVRPWPDSPMVEIDLHLPATEMQYWLDVPYIKISVGEFTFRDYTPFGWDTETSTCSLLIDTGHDGPGSSWARQLRTGDTIRYLKTDSTRQLPHPTHLIVGLGDNSSLAHLLALRQLTLPSIRFEGAFATDGFHTQDLLNAYFGAPLIPQIGESALLDWLAVQGYCTEHTSFYLTGNEQLVIRLRKLLKDLGHSNIRVKGFWS